MLYLFGAAGIAALAIVLAVLVLGGGDEDEQTALESAGCTLESFPALPNEPDHSDVPTLTTKPEWNSNPPTSGPHYVEWAIWNFYDEEVPLVKSVHNLEHGGVVIHYGPQVPHSGGGEAPDVLRRRSERPPRRPAALERRRDHAQRVDGAGRRDRDGRSRTRLARSLHNVRRGCVLRVHRGAPLPGSRAAARPNS